MVVTEGLLAKLSRIELEGVLAHEISHIRHLDVLPGTLQRGGRVLSAVYRVSPPSSSKPQGLALRLMIDPRRAVAVEERRATA